MQKTFVTAAIITTIIIIIIIIKPTISNMVSKPLQGW